jgi:hypothetical protein
MDSKTSNEITFDIKFKDVKFLAEESRTTRINLIRALCALGVTIMPCSGLIPEKTLFVSEEDYKALVETFKEIEGQKI